MLQHVSAQGQLLHVWENTDSINSVSIDMDSNLWVLSKNQLIGLSKTGNEFNREDLSDRLTDVRNLILDPLAEVLWLANRQQLLSIKISSVDPPLPPYSISDPSGISQVAQDFINGTLWLATANHLLAYDRSGRQVATIPLPKQLKLVEDLAVDSLSHDIWVGTKKAVARYSPNGLMIAQIPVSNELEALAIAPAFPRPRLTLAEPQNQLLTNNPRPTIRYQLSGLCGDSPCDPGETYFQYLDLAISLNGSPIGNQFIIERHQASYSLLTPVPDGQNRLSANATDIYGNVSATVISTFLVDTVPPHFLKFAPLNGSIVTEEEITISGSVDDAGAVVMMENLTGFGGHVLSSNPSNFSFRVPLALGNNNFIFTATDHAGNQQRATFAVVRTIPIALTGLSIEDGLIISSTHLTFSGSVVGMPGTTVSVNGMVVAIDAEGKFTLENIPLNSGKNTITIVVTSPDGQSITKVLTIFVSATGSWEPPVLISNVNAGFSGAPLVGIDKKGSVTVVWNETARGLFAKSKLMSNRYSVDSGWRTPQPIADNLNSGQKKLAFSVSENGDAVLIWSDCQSSGYCNAGSTAQRMYAMRFDADAGWNKFPVRIDNSVLNRNEPFPLLGADANGNAIAVFRVNDFLNLNYFNSVNGWSGLDSTLNIYRPNLDRADFTVSRSGSALLAWITIDDRLVARRFSPGIGWSSYDELYSQVDPGFRSPSVAIDGKGDSLVMSNYAKRILLHRHSPNLGWQTPLKLDGNENVFTRTQPHIAVSGRFSGDFAAAWETHNPYLKRFISENEFIANQWRGEKTLSDHIGEFTWGDSDPKIALNDKGDAAVVWSQYDGVKIGSTEITDVWANTRTSSAWSAPIRIESDESGEARFASVVIDSNGIATAVWRHLNVSDWTYRIFASRFNPGQPGVSAPVVTPPPDINLEATAVFTPVTLGQATATDSVDGNLSATPDTTGPFPVGANFVTWGATNSQGVTRTTVQNVVINDTTAPVLTIPLDIDITVADALRFPIAINLGAATATDIFAPVHISNNAPTAFDPGKTLVTWIATDSNGNKTTADQIVNVRFNGDIFIRISSPGPNQSVDAGETTVSGVFIGPPNSGVTVNGVIAAIYNGRFYANNVPVSGGNTTIKAVGTTQAGNTVEDSITVKADSSEYTVAIDPSEGIAPLRSQFTITNHTNAETEKIYADYDGDGANDEVKVGGDWVFRHTYATPGVYTPKFTIYNLCGTVREKKAVVVVQDAAAMDDQFKAIWSDMNAALKAGDVNTARTYLNQSASEKYAPVFNVLLTALPQIIDSYSPLRRVGIGDGLAEYTLMRIQHGEKRLYLIYFLRGFDGVWRVDSM